jgi:putative acetyltransferase
LRQCDHMMIRKASSTDKTNISKLHISSIKRLFSKHYTHAQLKSWTSVLTPSVYDQALKEKVFLVSHDSTEELLGLGILDIHNAEISAIYIHPDAVGNGIGTRLLSKLEEIARDNNVGRIAVHSTLNAKGFYKRHGYSEHGLTSHRLSNGEDLACVRMVKDLPTDADKGIESEGKRPRQPKRPL